MIKPTPGRVVWYMPGTERAALGGGDDVLAAIVCFVHTDRLVNLVVFGANGTTNPRTGVKLLQDEDQEDFLGQPHACWMPYQVGQAKKHEAADPIPAPPPATDEHVAVGSSLFSDPSKLKTQ